MAKCSLCCSEIEAGSAKFFTWGDRSTIAVICSDGWCDDSMHRWASERSRVLSPATPAEVSAGLLWRGSEGEGTEGASAAAVGAELGHDQGPLPEIARNEVEMWSEECSALAMMCFELADKTTDSVLAYDLQTLSARLEKLRARMEAAKRGGTSYP